jgi:hypothetical protein
MLLGKNTLNEPSQTVFDEQSTDANLLSIDDFVKIDPVIKITEINLNRFYSKSLSRITNQAFRINLEY